MVIQDKKKKKTRCNIRTHNERIVFGRKKKIYV